MKSSEMKRVVARIGDNPFECVKDLVGKRVVRPTGSVLFPRGPYKLRGSSTSSLSKCLSSRGYHDVELYFTLEVDHNECSCIHVSAMELIIPSCEVSVSC